MSKSNLTQVIVPAAVDNYTQGRKGYKICKITPHHMAGVLTAEQCGRIFQNSARNASSNYGIGNDGSIACYVEEENRAWTSSSSSNDCQAITIEVSNSQAGGEWPISDAAWTSLVNLCVDICRRYNFRLNYDGTPNGSLTRHNMFAATNCPGPYLERKMPELAKVVNKILDGDKEPVTPEVPSLKYKVGDVVTINGVYIASNSNTKLNPLRDTGAITKIVSGAKNPYLLENGSIGWTNDSCIVSKKIEEQAPAPQKKSTAQLADEIQAGKYGNGNERFNNLRAEGYTEAEIEAAQNEVNRRYGVKPSNPTPVSKSVQVGSRVRIKQTASKYCTGQTIPSSIKGKIYSVIQVGTSKYPSGVLLGGIMSWVNRSDVDVL